MVYQPTERQKEAARQVALTLALNVLFYGGSRSGKTFMVVMWIVKRAIRVSGTRHGLCRRNLADARTKLGDTLKDVFNALGMIDGEHYEHKAKIDTYIIYCPDGSESEIKMLGMDTKDGQYKKVLGDEYSSLYFNEANDISWEATEYAASRLAQKNALKKRFFFDCNPPTKAHWLYKWFFLHQNPEDQTQLDDEDFFTMQMNPEHNVENIDENYIEKVLKKMSKSKQKKFWKGEFGDEAFGKVFNDKHINMHRILPENFDVRSLDLIVIAVDPNVTSNPNASDDCGIIIGGKKYSDDHIYVLYDGTIEKAGPGVWPAAVTGYFRQFHANYVVAETNQGGELVVLAIQNYDKSIPVRKVHAKQGKFARAEPVAEMYAQGYVHHVGELPELEEEMVSFDPMTTKQSPNRMDALVYLVLELNGGRDLIFTDPEEMLAEEIAEKKESVKVRKRTFEIASAKMTQQQIFECNMFWDN
jgi:phage terminase large subunit-like protein